jgi:hypothetical protein
MRKEIIPLKIKRVKKFEDLLQRHVSHTTAGNPQLSQRKILSITQANFSDPEFSSR